MGRFKRALAELFGKTTQQVVSVNDVARIGEYSGTLVKIENGLLLILNTGGDYHQSCTYYPSHDALAEGLMTREARIKLGVDVPTAAGTTGWGALSSAVPVPASQNVTITKV